MPLIRMPLVPPRSRTYDLVILAGHAAVMPRNSHRVEPSIAIGMTAYDDHGTIQSDVWTFIESDESCEDMEGASQRKQSVRKNTNIAVQIPGRQS